MPKLTPYPFAALVTRMLAELEKERAVFGLPLRRFYFGDPVRDFSVSFHGSPAGSMLGPAAGPHTQMAQNIVLAWLAGSRILELKTVQVLDELEIPRPCIDMRTVGYNAEWSQELKLEESLAEYVKGAMLVEILRARGKLAFQPRFQPVCYDMSLGYDLAGIRSERVRAFVRGIVDAGPTIDRLRREIPQEHRELRDLDYPTQISTSVTLSTFHGCPPHEIAQMADLILQEWGLDCTVKLNPTLLGRQATEMWLHDVLGYADIIVPEGAFARDTTWDQAVPIVEQMGETAVRTGRHFGVKLTNTLVVENRGDFIPSRAKETYLSGPPLHVLAIDLVRKFRRHFGDRCPISFSAGIDHSNFPDAVALGLAPITVCTDLLKPRGYGRLPSYYQELSRRMGAVGAATIDEYILRAYGQAERALERTGGDPADPRRESCRQALASGEDLREAAGDDLYRCWVAESKHLNTELYAQSLLENPSYRREQNAAPPKRIERKLALFDCISCDLCLPVCPNAANFTFRPVETQIPIVKIRRLPEGWKWERQGSILLTERHQIASFADFCNDCGNCDTFCPEEGAPYLIKPRFFGSERAWRAFPELDGFYLERRREGDTVLGRMQGIEYRLDVVEDELRFAGPSVQVTFSTSNPRGSIAGDGPDEVDLTPAFIMNGLRGAILDAPSWNFINSLYLTEKESS